MVNRTIKVWIIVFTVVLLATLAAIPFVGGSYVPKIVNG